MNRRDLAIEQIAFARGYTVRLLDHIDPESWFRQPPGGVTHVAWQVGHLAMAEYRLALERIRGPLPRDADLISGDFLALFARDSVPDPDPGKYPRPDEIRAVFDRIHDEAMRELKTIEETELDRPVLKSHPLLRTKLWSLLWCAQHETLHAGQIGLVRRLLGQPPIW